MRVLAVDDVGPALDELRRLLCAAPGVEEVETAPDALAAVRHGVEATGREGLVQVAGEAQGSECVITVEDDGPGMDPEYAADVLAGRGRPGHLGLVNVDRRLRSVFGPDFDPAQYRMIVFGLAMVSIMIWRPRGLVTRREPSIYLKERKAVSGELVAEGRG